MKYYRNPNPPSSRTGNPTAAKKPQTGSFPSPYSWGGTFTIRSSGRPKTAILWADLPDGPFKRSTHLRALDEKSYSGLFPVVYPLGHGEYAFPATLDYFTPEARRGNQNLESLYSLGWDALVRLGNGTNYVLAFVGAEAVAPFGVADPDDRKSMPKAIVGELTNFTLMPPPKHDRNPRIGNPRPRSSAHIVDRYIAPVTPSERLRGETPREKVVEATPATVDGYRVAYLSREGDNRYTRDNTPRFYALKPDGTPDPDCYASQQMRGWLVSCYEDTTRVGSRKAALAYLAYPR